MDKNSFDKSVELLAWCRKFCPTKNFVRRKFFPMFQYKSEAKIGQKCRNFALLSKILSDEIFCPSKILSDELLSDTLSGETLSGESDEMFCPSKILSNISIQKSGENWTKVSKFRLGVENFVRRNFVLETGIINELSKIV